jgi:hypothetical protein
MMRTAIVLGFVLGAAVGAPREAAAQLSASSASVVLPPGSRVRVTAPATGRVVGTLLSATADSVRLEVTDGSSLALSTTSLSALELSAGVRRNAWRGAGIGLLVGAGVGGVVGLATYRRAECYDNPIEGFFCDLVNRTSRSVTVVSDAALFGTAGAIVGAIVGQVGRERWVRVTLGRSGVRVGITPWRIGGDTRLRISVARQFADFPAR